MQSIFNSLLCAAIAGAFRDDEARDERYNVRKSKRSNPDGRYLME